MTQEMRQLEQMQALTASRNRVIDCWMMMVPLVEQLAADGNALAQHLVSELDKAWDVMVSENMSAREFLAENENTA